MIHDTVVILTVIIFMMVLYVLYIGATKYEVYRANKGSLTPLDSYIKFELLKEEYEKDKFTEYETLQDYMVSVLDPKYRPINPELSNIDDIVTDSKNISSLKLIKLTEPNIKKQVDEFMNASNKDLFKSNLPPTDYNNLKRILKKYH